jgi:serine/threonine protein kinase
MGMTERHAQLRRQLESGIQNADSPKTSRRFAAIGLETGVLTTEELCALFKEQSLNRKQAQQCAEMTIKDRSGKSRRKVLATILLRPHSYNLEHYMSWLRQEIKPNPPNFPFPRDDDLPLALATAQKIFNNHGCPQEFVDDQAIFLPLDYKEGAVLVIEKEDNQYRRHPVVGDPEFLGGGASGVVEKITLAQGHFVHEDGHTNRKPLVLAQKVFDTKSSKIAVENFLNEGMVAAKLKGSPLLHKHLVRNVGSIVVKDKGETYKCKLLYEFANCNLKQALSEDMPQYSPPRGSLTEKHNIIDQLARLVSALYHLHDNDIYHLDIKPDNILIVEREEHNKKDLFWAVADYNLSVALEYPPRPNETSSTSGRRAEGTYQGPEVLLDNHGNSRVGWWTDLWSLGCVFLTVLAYVYEGSAGLSGFTDLRAEAWGQERDAFWILENDKYILNPKVSEYSEKISDLAYKCSDEEGAAINEALELLNNKVLIADPEVRRDQAKNVFHEGMKSIVRSFNDLYRQESRQSTDSSSPSSRQSESEASRPTPPQTPRSTRTELCRAVKNYHGNVTELESLLRSRDNPRHPTKRCNHCGETPLHAAIRLNGIKSMQSHIPIIQLLLKNEFSAALDCQDATGKTPISRALDRMDYYATEALLDRYARRGSPVPWDEALDTNRTRYYSDDYNKLIIRKHTAAVGDM